MRRETNFRRSAVLVVVVALVAASGLTAQMKMDMPMPGPPQTIRGLGTTSFTTSAKSPQAQAAFLRGLLLLHLFEYTDAATSFIVAEKLDPGFSMAYWGEAMTSNHGVWNQVDVTAGQAALAKLAPTAAERAARTPDPREAAYLASVELLYDGRGGDGPKGKAERDLRYAGAMQALSERYPDDRNAQLFYALALLGQSESVRDVPVYLKAAAIAKTIFRLEPDNPGAAHYWIHGMDDPEHAGEALEAARALSKIAPDAPHAQHMCSHIFMALGMWDDVVTANVEAIRVGDLQDKAGGFPPLDCGHYPNWLEYGYFQQGRFRAAQQAVAACQTTITGAGVWTKAHPELHLYGAKNPVRMRARLAEELSQMQGMAVIEGQDWTAPQSVDASLPALATAWADFSAGYAAVRRNDLPDANAALKAMQGKAKDFAAGKDLDPEEVQTLGVGIEELSGLIHAEEKSGDGGLAELRHAVAVYESMAFAFGPPTTVKPPEEALGEVLLEKRDTTGARQAFEQSLKRAPRRTISLLGLARTEHMAGDDAASHQTYQTLAEIWHDADADAPGVAEARKAAKARARTGD